MASLTSPVYVNPNRAYWLSNVPPDVLHSTVQVQELDASIARISTGIIEDLTTSTARFSTFGVQNLDVSGMFTSSITGNFARFSTVQWDSDLSGGLGYVQIQSDPSGVLVKGDPIVFTNLVYLYSTINVIQVSTIVDTDIFAQRGFFSTLSTGNFSANLVYINKAFISSLETSDLSGFAEQNWSLYPTVSGEIIMSTGYNLSNVGSNLFFAGQQLATPSDISGIDTWAYHPALSSLKMNNNVITGLSTINFQDGATLTSQTGNNLLYNGQTVSYGAAGSASSWANYPAINTVQLNSNNINSPGIIRTTAAGISTVADGGASVASFTDINLIAQNGNRGRINLTANGGFNNGVNGEINLVANGNTLAGVGTGGLVTITANTPLATPSNLTSAIKFSASGINSYAGAIPSVGSLAGYNFIYGTGGVNICAGLPPVLPNIPGTTYLYGTFGVTTSSDLYVPTIQPYWNGITTPPDLVISGRYIVPNLAQVYLQLSNVKYMYMDGAAQILNARYISTVSSVANNLTVQNVINTSNLNYTFAAGQSNLVGQLLAGGIQATLSNSQILGYSNISTVNVQLSTINGLPLAQIQTPSNITCSNITTSLSTQTSTLLVGQWGQISTLLFQQCLLGVSSTVLQQRTRWLQISESISGLAPNPGLPDVRLTNFSSLNAYNVSTVDLWTSTINGQPYVPGGGGGGQTSFFSTASISSLNVSSMLGNNVSTNALFTSSFAGPTGAFINIQTPLRFQDSFSGALDNVHFMNTNPNNVPLFTIGASTILLTAQNTTVINGLSTTRLQALSTYTSTLQAAQISTLGLTTSSLGANSAGSFFTIQNPIRFDTQFAGALDNLHLINSSPLAVPLLNIGASTITLAGANTNVLNSLSTVQLGVSSIQTSSIISKAGNPNIDVVGNLNNPGNGISTSQMNLSSIQIFDASGLGGLSSILNVAFNNYTGNAPFPQGISLENYINTTDNLDLWLVGNADGATIKSWTNNRSTLSELFIGANTLTLDVLDEVIVATGNNFSQITATSLTTSLVSTNSIITLSSINGNDARPAYTNNLALSSFNLYAGSTTLMAWSTTTTSSNINTSGYDVVVGLNGTFKIGCSFQFLNGGANEEIEYFFLKNDSVIAESGSMISIGNNDENISYAEIIEPLVNGDKIQIGCFTNSAQAVASTINGNVVICPAAILTVYKID